MNTSHIAAVIQHTLIKPGLTADQMITHCEQCLQFGFNAAMVPGCWVPLVRDTLRGTSILVASAVDFPLGMMSTAGKVAEAISLAHAGADEIDIGVQIGWLKSGRSQEFHDDIAAVVRAVAPVRVKVMLELPLLTPNEQNLAVDLAVQAGVAYVKNASSGQVGVATPEAIRYLRGRAPAHVKVKGSGGINTATQVIALLDAGADLVGTSAGLAIVQGAAAPTSTY